MGSGVSAQVPPDKEDNAVVSVEKEIAVSAIIEKEKGHKPHYAIEIEYENIKTRKKYVTAYSVEVEIKAPLWERKGHDHHSHGMESLENGYDVVPRFKIHMTPYKRQIFGQGIPDPDLKNAMVIGKTEVLRDGEKFSISVFGIGAEFSREIELGSSRLRLILEMGLHTLGYRHFQRGDHQTTFSGFELIGAYPGAEIEYDLNKKFTLAFSIEDEAKVSTAVGEKPIIENTFASKFYLKPKFENGFFKHLDSFWYKKKSRNNSPNTFESEKAHEFGVTWSFKKEKRTEAIERCTLTDEEKAAGWKCINP